MVRHGRGLACFRQEGDDGVGVLTRHIEPAVVAQFDVERVDQLVSEVRAAFPHASDFTVLRPWCGMRPATPKGTPVVGATPHSNLWLNVGHGALGFTLALATGRILADLAAGRQPAVPLEGFTLH